VLHKHTHAAREGGRYKKKQIVSLSVLWNAKAAGSIWISGAARLYQVVKTDERLISRTRSGGEVRLRSFYLSEVEAVTGVPGGVEGFAGANRNNTPTRI
jgi:hypothetical protein